MIKLKRVYDSKDAVPPEHIGLFKETGEGKWTLDVEVDGLEPSKRVNDFRDTNVKLIARLRAYGDAEFGDGEVTPERVQELMAKAQQLDDAKLVDKTELQKKLDERTEEMRKTHLKEVEKLKAENAEKTAKISRLAIESAAVESALPLGLRASAHEDLIDRVLKIFKVDAKGDPVAYEADGKTLRYGSDGKPLTIKEVVKGFATDNGKHLFEDNGGVQGDPSKRGSRDGDRDDGYDPWDSSDGKVPNITEQNKIINKDPDKAERMAARHGIPLKIGESTRAKVKAGV